MGIRAGVAAALAVALTVMALAPAPSVNAASVAAQPVVVGNRLVDARTGALFTPRGANWPSFEYACWQGWGYSGAGSTQAEADLMASWRINTVRIPLNQDCWLGLRGSPVGSGRTAEGYRAAVEAWVAKLNAAGIVAILDLHHSAPPGVSAHGQRATPDSQSTAFWSSVAARFASNKSVMFDLFNEPYSRYWNGGWAFTLTWPCWRDGGCTPPIEDDFTALSGATYTATGMSALVSSVRSAGATQPILLGGLDYANDLRQWLAYRPTDSQLVASWHNYPGQRCHTTTCWNSEIAAVAAVVPVVATEFGQTDGGSGYLTSFMTWAESKGIGYLPWAWWRVTDAESLTNSRYALVDAANQPKAPSGVALYNHLASLPETPDTPPVVTRHSGADRFAVAVELSQQAFPTTAPVVYVVNGLGFADALSAGPAAAVQGGPLLLSRPDVLPPSVRAEILRLAPARIVVVGGPASISDAVFAELSGLQPATTRVSGADRYAASRAVLDYAFDSPALVYVSTGEKFPDALSAAAAGGALGAPVLLVPGSVGAIDSATSAALGAAQPDRVIVVGGPSSVTTGIEAGIGSIAPTTRISGPDRYAASLAIAQDAFPTTTDIFFATGLTFPDALAASAWAGRIDAPLITLPGVCVPDAVLRYVEDSHATRIHLVGGPVSLSSAVEALTPCG